MLTSYCGLDCEKCDARESCPGCMETGGSPFKAECPLAKCCKDRGNKSCGDCGKSGCELKSAIIDEFNALGIEDMPRVTELNVLLGSYINLEYGLSNGQRVKLLEDEKMYFGNQLEKNGCDRCYGIAADENYLLVCEYGCGGENPEIIVYKRRK